MLSRRRRHPERHRLRGRLGSRHGRKELLRGLLHGEITMLHVADILRESGMPRQKRASELRWLQRRRRGTLALVRRALAQSGVSQEHLRQQRASLEANLGFFGRKISSGKDASAEARRIVVITGMSIGSINGAIENLRILRRGADNVDTRDLAGHAMAVCRNRIAYLRETQRTFELILISQRGGKGKKA